MFFVYVLQSVTHPEEFYVGQTEDIDRRIREHNSGKGRHTRKFVPLQIATYLAVSDRSTARSLERYLKSPSGKAFTNKHLLKSSNFNPRSS